MVAPENNADGLLTNKIQIMQIRYLHALLLGSLCCCGAVLFPAQDVRAQRPTPVPTPQWRPLYHYTPLKNWTNDPNGLIYLNGEYLLYNQYNPFDYKWGHMSWGHAVSKDLVHWNHLAVAIPEIMGTDTTLRFSGSAVWDKNNSSGFCTSSKGCLVAIYTADQPLLKRESQFLAYSNDGGLTFTNYDKNPVIDLHMRDFRDPNVIWLPGGRSPNGGQWLMTVALPREHKVRFYGSHDLKNWELLSEFGGDQGDTRKIWECPSLTPLPVDGDTSRMKWLLMVSSGNPDAATGMQYLVGDFDGKTFTNSYPADNKQFVDYGSTYYAAIPWNNLPPGQHMMLGWLTPTATVTYPWTGQMSIPRDISLRTTADGIKLFQAPASVISRSLERLSRGRVVEKKDLHLTDKEMDLGSEAGASGGAPSGRAGGGNAGSGGNAYWIKAELKVGATGETGFRIARKKDASGKVSSETSIVYDATSHQLVVEGENKTNQHMTLRAPDGVLRLQILFDKSSLEIFADDGEKVLTTMLYPDAGADGLSLFASGAGVWVKDLKIWNLAE
jgi:fructan beta-fructosidase